MILTNSNISQHHPTICISLLLIRAAKLQMGFQAVVFCAFCATILNNIGHKSNVDISLLYSHLLFNSEEIGCDMTVD